MCRTFLTSLAI